MKTNRTLISYLIASAAVMIALAFIAPVYAQSDKLAQLKYKVGQQVEFDDGGAWYKGVIKEVRDDSARYDNHQLYAPYHVVGTGYPDNHHWVTEAQIRPAGSGPTAPVGSQ